MGQGLFTKVAQVVAEEFGVPIDFVRITATNTAKVPNTSPTAASSGSDINGMAAQIGAREIKKRMVEFACGQWGVSAEEIVFRDGLVLIGNKSMSFGELAKTCRLNRVQLSAAGFYKTPTITWDRASATGRPFLYFAFGASCSEVAIDTLTGEMKVVRVDILHDVGKSLNPAIDIGQVEGGFIQGMGWLTTEELVFDAKGRRTTHAPATYKIPVASDVPADFRTVLHMRPNHARGDDLSLEGGGRAAADAADLGLLRDSRRHSQRSLRAGRFNSMRLMRRRPSCGPFRVLIPGSAKRKAECWSGAYTVPCACFPSGAGGAEHGAVEPGDPRRNARPRSPREAGARMVVRPYPAASPARSAAARWNGLRWPTRRRCWRIARATRFASSTRRSGRVSGSAVADG